MRFSRIGVFAGGAALWGAAVACSSSSSGDGAPSVGHTFLDDSDHFVPGDVHVTPGEGGATDGPHDTGVGAVDGPHDSAGGDTAVSPGSDTGVGDAGSCVPASLGSFSPAFHAPPSPQIACTTAQLDEFYVDCYSSTVSGTCDSFASANMGCFLCLGSNSTPTSSTWGPILAYTNYDQINIGSCIAEAQPGASLCASNVQALVECEHAACDHCPVNTQSDLDAFDACETAASNGDCKRYLDAANTCVAALSDAGGALHCIPQGTNNIADFEGLAAPFCGGGN